MPTPRRAETLGSIPTPTNNIQVAPYLTHTLSHHGQITLIPPENAGRIRKASSKVKTKKKSTGTPTTGASNSIVNAVINAGRRTRSPQVYESAGIAPLTRVTANIATESGSRSDYLRTEPDFSVIPDFPPPSFQEAMRNRSTYVPIDISNAPHSPATTTTTPGMRFDALPVRFGTPTEEDDAGFASDYSLELIEHPTPEMEAAVQSADRSSPSLDLLEDVQPFAQSRRHLSLSPLRTLFPSRPFAHAHPYPYSGQPSSPTSVFIHSTTSLGTTSSPPPSRPTSPTLSHRLFSLGSKGKERESIDDWEVVDTDIQRSAFPPDTMKAAGGSKSARIVTNVSSEEQTVSSTGRVHSNEKSLRDRKVPPPPTSIKVRRPPPTPPAIKQTSNVDAVNAISIISTPDNPPGPQRKPPPPLPPKKRSTGPGVRVASPLGMTQNAYIDIPDNNKASTSPILSTPSEEFQRALQVPLPSTPADAVFGPRSWPTPADESIKSSTQHHYTGRPLPRPPPLAEPFSSFNPVMTSRPGMRTRPSRALEPLARLPIDSTYAAHENFRIAEFRIPQPEELLIDFGDETPAAEQPTENRRTNAPLSLVNEPQVGPFSQMTDLDALIAQLNDPQREGQDYETLLLVSEFVGPGNVNLTGSRVLDLIGPIVVERRRTLKDGRVKLKITLRGAAVDKCHICLLQFRENDAGVLASAVCSHSFHVSCLARWVGNGINSSCPICRRDIDFKTI